MSAGLSAILGSLTFVSAFLVISIQPIVVSILLPVAGGTPVVWSVMQTVFQLLLLFGYLGASSLVPPSGFRRLLVPLLVLGGITSGVSASFASALLRPGPSLSPEASVVLVTIALLFMLLSTLSVATQLLLLWCQLSANPVWLYAASNTGSLAAVVFYPLLIEPIWAIDTQVLFWFAGTSGALLAAGALVTRLTAGLRPREPVDRTSRPPLLLMFKWCAAGSLSVGVSLTVTSYLSIDLGSHPLVWLAPFGLYLASLAAAFTRRGYLIVSAIAKVAPAAILIVMSVAMSPEWTTEGRYVLVLVATGIILAHCNSWLSAHRPLGSDLRFFYAAMTLGGVIAGMFVSFGVHLVLEPALYGPSDGRLQRFAFDSPVPETAICAGLTILLLGSGSRGELSSRDWLRTAAQAVALGMVVALVAPRLLATAPLTTPTLLKWWASVALLAMVSIRTRTRTAVAGAAIIVLIANAVGTPRPGVVIARTRSPFGTLTVVDSATQRILRNGTTMHGHQSLDCVAIAAAGPCSSAGGYYHEAGPVGRLFSHFRKSPRSLQIGVVGLGAGALANYCGDGDSVVFYEIDAEVLTMATMHFTFLTSARSRCRAVDTRVGDARLLLRREPSESIDLLFVDAFASDSIPVHLITVEALSEYRRVLSPNGAIALHLSSRRMNLVPVGVNSARMAGLWPVAVTDSATTGGQRLATMWVIASPAAEVGRDLQVLMTSSVNGVLFKERPLRESRTVWSDAQHSILPVLRQGIELAR